MEAFDAIGALRIGLASPEHIRSWSHGEVTKPETINYRTQKPVKDGLFCERIFGPTRDWSCACGKYQRKRTTGFVCDICGVELAPARVRRERMGHIELASPIVHPWYIRDRTMSLLLDLTSWQLSTILGYQRYLVLQVNEDGRGKELCRQRDVRDRSEVAIHKLLATLKVGDLLEEGQYQALSILFPHTFQAKTGAEAVRTLLDFLDLDALAEQLHREIEEGSNQKKAMRRLQVVEAFRSSGQRPSWMVLTCIPVLPPELRPLLVLDGGRIASSDLNDL